MQIAHNPALGPHVPWDLDKVSVADASALIDKLPPPGRSMLARLATQPDEWVTMSDLAQELAGGDVTEAFTTAVHAATHRIGQFCDAFGRHMLIDTRGDAFRLRSAEAQMVRLAIDSLDA